MEASNESVSVQANDLLLKVTRNQGQQLEKRDTQHYVCQTKSTKPTPTPKCLSCDAICSEPPVPSLHVSAQVIGGKRQSPDLPQPTTDSLNTSKSAALGSECRKTSEKRDRRETIQLRERDPSLRAISTSYEPVPKVRR